MQTDFRLVASIRENTKLAHYWWVPELRNRLPNKGDGEMRPAETLAGFWAWAATCWNGRGGGKEQGWREASLKRVAVPVWFRCQGSSWRKGTEGRLELEVYQRYLETRRWGKLESQDWEAEERKLRTNQQMGYWVITKTGGRNDHSLCLMEKENQMAAEMRKPMRTGEGTLQLDMLKRSLAADIHRFLHWLCMQDGARGSLIGSLLKHSYSVWASPCVLPMPPF